MDADVNDGGIQFYQTHQQNEEHQMETAQQTPDFSKVDPHRKKINKTVHQLVGVKMVAQGLLMEGVSDKAFEAYTNITVGLMAAIIRLQGLEDDEETIVREAEALMEVRVEEFRSYIAASRRKGGAK